MGATQPLASWQLFSFPSLPCFSNVYKGFFTTTTIIKLEVPAVRSSTNEKKLGKPRRSAITTHEPPQSPQPTQDTMQTNSPEIMLTALRESIVLLQSDAGKNSNSSRAAPTRDHPSIRIIERSFRITSKSVNISRCKIASARSPAAETGTATQRQQEVCCSLAKQIYEIPASAANLHSRRVNLRGSETAVSA